MSSSQRWVAAVAAAAACVLPVSAQLPGGVTTRVSIASNGSQADSSSSYAVLSADGRYVAFTSSAANLVAGDTNGTWDVFVRDRDLSVTTRVSVASNATQGNGYASRPSLSADGQVVAFVSGATNLVPGDTNARDDIFVRDRAAGTTTRVSVATGGTEADSGSDFPALSADGRFVAFSSDATNLVAGDTNVSRDIFVRDRATDTTTRVSVATNGAQANNDSIVPALSADGRYVAFASNASNLVPDDTNNRMDIFVHDRVSGATTRVSVASNGAQANNDSIFPALSADGRLVVFQSVASNLVPNDTNAAEDVFVHDCVTGATTRVSVAPNGAQADGYSVSATISADGRFVAFASMASNLVAGDTNGTRDVFVHDRQAGAATRVNVATDGTQANYDSESPALSADGRSVAFGSNATNLVPDDSNFAADIFVHAGQAPPSAPTGLTGGAAGSTLTLSWSTPVGGGPPTSYTIEAGSGPGLANLASVATGNTLTTFVANGVGSGLYFIRVRATNSYGKSGPSNEVAVSVAVPGAPRGLTGTVTGSSISLSWTAPASGGAPTSYTIEAGSAPGLANLATVATGSTATTFNAPGVASGTYYVRVRATNATGASGPSNEVILQVGPPAGSTARVSVTSDGTQANGMSSLPVVSADGRYVAFMSGASNLVAGDTNGYEDIFVRDRLSGVTTRASVATDGTQASDTCYSPAISADGRYVAFHSYSGTLVPGDTNGTSDIFVRDRNANTTTRVSVRSDGDQVYSWSLQPSISGDGRYVAFVSSAPNLVDDDTNGVADVFVHDRNTGATTRVSVTSDGSGANDQSNLVRISANGKYVAFVSYASNLVPDDTNGQPDVFVHDRDTGATTRVSVASDGAQGSGGGAYDLAISADGRYVAFSSSASNLVAGDTNDMSDVFVHDRGTGATTRVSVTSNGVQANGSSVAPAISADGGFVAFESNADNLVPGKTGGLADVFLHRRAAGMTVRVSVATSGVQGNGDSEYPSLSADGQYVAFASAATNLVTGDTNGQKDIYVRTILSPPGAPAGLTAGATGSTVTLSWQPPTEGGRPTSYIIEAGSAAGLSDLANVSTGNTQTSFSAGGVGAGLYYVRVRAANADGTSLPSNEALLFVGCSGLPGAPFLWQTTAPQPGGVLQLQWTAAANAPTTYLLDAGSQPGLADLAHIDLGNTLAFNAAGVPNGIYYIQVRGTNPCGVGSASNVVRVNMF
jgi:Tol biopolymer transport system component